MFLIKLFIRIITFRLSGPGKYRNAVVCLMSVCTQNLVQFSDMIKKCQKSVRKVVGANIFTFRPSGAGKYRNAVVCLMSVCTQNLVQFSDMIKKCQKSVRKVVGANIFTFRPSGAGKYRNAVVCLSDVCVCLSVPKICYVFMDKVVAIFHTLVVGGKILRKILRFKSQKI